MLRCWLRVLVKEEPTGKVDDNEEDIDPEEQPGFNEGAEDEEAGIKEGAEYDKEEDGFKEGAEIDEEEAGIKEGSEENVGIGFGTGVSI